MFIQEFEWLLFCCHIRRQQLFAFCRISNLILAFRITFVCLKNFWEKKISALEVKQYKHQIKVIWKREEEEVTMIIIKIISSRCHQTPQHLSHCWLCAYTHTLNFLLYLFFQWLIKRNKTCGSICCVDDKKATRVENTLLM